MIRILFANKYCYSISDDKILVFFLFFNFFFVFDNDNDNERCKSFMYACENFGLSDLDFRDYQLPSIHLLGIFRFHLGKMYLNSMHI